MKKSIFLLCCALLFCGFGLITEDDTKLAKVPENYRISVTDIEGYTVAVANATIADALYLTGNTGKGKHIVDLKDVVKATVKPVDEKKVLVTVFYRDGSNLEMTMEGKSKIKGKSKFGFFSITLRDVRELSFVEKVAASKK